MLVSDGTHDTAHSQAVEIVVDEDQAAQQDGGQLRTHTALDVLFCPTAKGCGTAGLVHQADHSAQDHQEDQDAHVVAVGDGSHNAIVKHMKHGGFKGKVGVQQAAHQNTDEQGAVYLLGDQRQCDGNDGRQQGPEGVVKLAGGFHVTGTATGFAVGNSSFVREDDTGSAAVGAFDHLGAALLGGVVRREGRDGHGAAHQQYHCQQGQQPSSQVSHDFSLLTKIKS